MNAGTATSGVVDDRLPPLRLAPHAAAEPSKIAVTMADGSTSITFSELESRSSAIAAALGAAGLRARDRVAILMENRIEYLVLAFAAQRSGLLYVPVNWHLTAEEAEYIVCDSEATVLFSSARLQELADRLTPKAPNLRLRVLVDAIISASSPPTGWTTLEDFEEQGRSAPTPPAIEGQWMFYSSGTTGRPKGIVRPPTAEKPYGSGTAIDALLGAGYGFDERSVYLSAAPQYHAAPLGWSMGTLRRGGSVVVMEKFEPLAALEAIERHRVTHAQFVPTMFIRMLKLSAEQRLRPDISSLRVAVHAAAPCPVDVKRRMMAWWGPIIHEYYGGSEGTGFVAIGPDEWLARPGSVGRSKRGPVHVVAEDGTEAPTGTAGVVWFEGATPFEYHGDPAKTSAAFDTHGWSTLGDIGYLDADGYLFLTDRATDLIIAGGVNIYPQEIEPILLMHERVLDCGVVGAPHPEFGEEVVAFVQLTDGGAIPGELIEVELRSLAQLHLAAFKCPRRYVFVDEMPRLPTGKLLRRRLRERLAV